MAAFFWDFDHSPSPPTNARAADRVCMANRRVKSSPMIRKAMIPTTKVSLLEIETSLHQPTNFIGARRLEPPDQRRAGDLGVKRHQRLGGPSAEPLLQVGVE